MKKPSKASFEIKLLNNGGIEMKAGKVGNKLITLAEVEAFFDKARSSLDDLQKRWTKLYTKEGD